MKASKQYVLHLVLFTAFVFMLVSPVFAQLRPDLINENFTATTFPPAGWTIDAHAANWSRVATNNAGGTAGEARLNWSPSFVGDSYFISPVLDTNGQSAAYLEFRHMVDHYGAGYSVGVATRSNNGPWTSIMLITPDDSVPAELKSLRIANNDLGSSSFQFAFYFTGDSYQINYWYIDNIRLYPAPANDAAVTALNVETNLTVNVPVIPTADLENRGLNPATATGQLNVYVWDTLDTSYSGTATANLNPGELGTLTFPAYTPAVNNEVYRFEVIISSPDDSEPANNTAETYANTYTTPKQKVVLEIGTGTWCQYCPGAAMGADDLVDGNYDVAVVENHNGDAYANDYSNARNSYYGITGYPTAFFDGILGYVGGSNTATMFNNYLPLYNQRINIKSPAEIGIYGELIDGTYNVNFIIQKTAHTALTDLVAQLCLTQSNIDVTWQGHTGLNFVNRMMFPNQNGSSIDLSAADSFNLPFTFSLNTAWGGWDGDFELVAFIQNPVTKEIIQGNCVNLVDLQPVAVTDPVSALVVALRGNHPNPFSGSTNISFSTSKTAPVSINVYNTKGQLVRSLLNADLAKGEHQIAWDGRNNLNQQCGNGIYFLKLTSGQITKTGKLMLLK